jgi:hypothetical protein
MSQAFSKRRLVAATIALRKDFDVQAFQQWLTNLNAADQKTWKDSPPKLNLLQTFEKQHLFPAFFSGAMKLLKMPAVIVGMAHFGYPDHLIRHIGVLEVACTIVYLIPRTAVLGAILVTGYLGGATATNVRVEDRSFIGPVFAGVFAWAGLYLRWAIECPHPPAKVSSAGLS